MNRTAQFEDCDGGLATGRVPVETLREVVPEDFIIDASFGVVPTVGSVLATAVTCARVVINSTVLPDVSMLRFSVFVTPRNESWRGDGNDYYVLDTWFSSPELAAWFKPTPMLSEPGTFDREAIPPGAEPRIENWTVDGASCDTDSSFRVSGNNGPADEGMFFHWAGPGPYERIDVFQAFTQDVESDFGALMVTGSCASQRVFDGMPVSGTGYLSSYNATWTISGVKYG